MVGIEVEIECKLAEVLDCAEVLQLLEIVVGSNLV